MAFNNRVTKLLNIKYPIVCGGMHYVGYAGLAAAVSNAGGLGIITALTQQSPEDLRQEIRKCKTLLNSPTTPIGVNFTLLPVGKPPDYDGYANVIIDEKVQVVETAGRNPAKWIKLFKSNGLVCIHKCVAIRHALTAQRVGADIISMDGFECGGHPGEEVVGNWILLPAAAAKLSIPFIASGGCANGQHLAAAFALGAEGINMGTRFMATIEAPIHIKIKQALVSGDERSTTHIMTTLRNTERVYKNKTSDIIQKIEKEKPGNIAAIYKYVRGENYRKSFQETGDTESSVWSCGQSMALIDDIPSCKDLIKNIVNDALEIINRKIPSQLPKSKL
eukprot:154237_1